MEQGALKVLHIGEYARGGVATYINELVAYQAEILEITDINLLLASRSAGRKFNLNSENIFYYNFNRKINTVLLAIFQIRRHLKNLRPDIVHVHSSYAGLLARIACLFISETPIIIYCAHGWSFNMEISPLKKRLLVLIEKTLTWKTDLIINISRYENDSAYANKLPIHKMILIYSGVREKEEVDEPALSLDKNLVNLLFVGRFDKQKGLDVLLRVFNERRFNNIKLYLAGGSVLDSSNLNIPLEVVDLGWVDEEKIDSYYQSFDAVIMPSRWEGFGLVAIEAMRNAKPVIASNRCSLPEIVSHGINGYLFDLEDEQELVAILLGLDKKVLKEMGQQGYEIYKKRFTSSRMNAEVIQQYQRILK
jgi:glycosyltransferase involved in cell wall biosynthesis